MFGFFRSVVEAVLEKGVRGLIEEVPGGKFFCNVADRVCEKQRERRRLAKQVEEQRLELEKIAQASYDVAREEASRAFQEVMAEQHVSLSPQELDAGIQWVAAIPEATRASLKRKDDPTGMSVPLDFVLNSGEDVLKLLPVRPPRFASGNRVPGRDEWILERPLGIGGFGEVWLTRHTEAEELAARAIKFCFDQTGRDLIREAKLVGRVMAAGQSNEHVVPMLDLKLSGDNPWLMFEYVAGGNLTDWLHQIARQPGEAKVTQVIAAIKQLCRGVGVFHALSPALVHRDLKPSNILLDRATKRLRVTDFGIGAVTAEESNRQESRGESTHGGRLHSYLRGSHTPTYSSPQQRQGSDPDPRDDVHALGVIGYQLLMSDLMAAPGADMLSDLEEKSVPDELSKLLVDCVARNPGRRPANAMDLLAKLDGLGRTKTVSPPPPPPPVIVSPPPVIVSPPPPPPPPPTRKAGDVVEFPLPGGLKMAFCWIPPGNAQLGSPKSERDAALKSMGILDWILEKLFFGWLAYEDEETRGSHTTKGFWLGRYPVTQAEWQALMGKNPSHFRTGGSGADKVNKLDTSRFPVESVTWDDCRQLLEKMNALGEVAKSFGFEGKFSLPHEDEWEYACRGGKGNKQAFYFGNELNGTQANCAGNYPFSTSAKGAYLKRPTPVGTYAAKWPHPWGLCDLHGNVSEWCESNYEQSTWRVLRGGAWDENSGDCRSASSAWGSPDSRCGTRGLRVCLRLEK